LSCHPIVINQSSVFHDQLTQGGEGTMEVALNRHWKMNVNATGIHARRML
jgi:iron complex outermembrane receptor protein